MILNTDILRQTSVVLFMNFVQLRYDNYDYIVLNRVIMAYCNHCTPIMFKPFRTNREAFLTIKCFLKT